MVSTATNHTVSQEVQADPFSLYQYELDEDDHLTGYAAGFPTFPRSFERDIIIAGILASRADILEAGLKIADKYRAKTSDPLTGAEAGKVPHEIPGAVLDGRIGRTDFNACDTTSLNLIAAEGYRQLAGKAAEPLLENLKPGLRQAVGYILNHIEDDIFVERPPAGALGFALKVTSWKDSVLPQPGKEEPAYPVTISQTHFIAARGLRSASQILAEPELGHMADRMFVRGIREFIRPDGYVVYRDSQQDLVQPSSDELHNLAFIPTFYANLLPFWAIRKRAKDIATPFGYMCTPIEVANGLTDNYHGNQVWTHDNGLINYGARKFNLKEAIQVSSSVSTIIDQGQELFTVAQSDKGTMMPIRTGNSHQLWALATKQYFDGNSSLAKPDLAWL